MEQSQIMEVVDALSSRLSVPMANVADAVYMELWVDLGGFTLYTVIAMGITLLCVRLLKEEIHMMKAWYREQEDDQVECLGFIRSVAMLPESFHYKGTSQEVVTIVSIVVGTLTILTTFLLLGDAVLRLAMLLLAPDAAVLRAILKMVQ